MPASAATSSTRRRASRRRSPWCRRRGCAAALLSPPRADRVLQRLDRADPQVVAAGVGHRAASLSRYTIRGSSASIDRRLRQRAALPFARERMREQRRPGTRPRRPAGSRRRSGSGTRPARRTRRRSRTCRTGRSRRHHGGGGTRSTFPRPARCSPQGGGPGTHVDALAHAHRHVVAQRRERVHLRGDRTRPRARDRIDRPHAGMPLGQVLGNRQRVPHDDVAVVQHRHESGRRERLVRRIRPMPTSATGTSSNGAPDNFATSQPRSDHDEYVLLPT